MDSSNWCEVKLGDVAEKIGMGPFGSNIKIETFVKDGVPVVSGNHLNMAVLQDNTFNYVTSEHAEKLKSANVYRGDVIFTHAGNIKNVSYIPEDSKYDRYILSQRQFFLRSDNSKLDPAFITYYFKSPLGQHKLLANSSQVGVPSIAQPVTYFRSLKINLPPLNEQRKIAKILGDLDRKIELNRRMNETLEQIGRALFKKYFIDNPERQSWDTDNLTNVFNIAYGKNLSTAKLLPSGYPVFGGNGKIGFYDKYLYENRQVLISCRGNGSGLVNISDKQSFVTNNSLVMEIPDKSYFTFEFLKYFAFTRREGFKEYVTGSAQPQLTIESLAKCKFTVPPRDQVEKFTDLLKKNELQLNILDSETAALISVRDLLLPRLIGGNIVL